MFESAAIFMYLADKTGKFLSKEPRARYETIQWMMIQMTSIGPMSGQLVHFTRFAPKETSAYALSRYGTEVKRLYELVDKRLATSKFVGGPEYSIADMAIWPWFRNYELLGVKPADVPNVARWVDTIAARPAAARTLAQVAELMKKSSRDTATPDDVDRLLGRGKYARA
jgi:GST-like protein